jgi:hypothetical protein
MFSLNRLHILGLFLLVAMFLTPVEMGSAQQQPSPNSNPQNKSGQNRNPDRRAAQKQIKAAAIARAQSDPAFNVYMNALSEHDKQVKAFVKARKGGAK